MHTFNLEMPSVTHVSFIVFKKIVDETRFQVSCVHVNIDDIVEVSAIKNKGNHLKSKIVIQSGLKINTFESPFSFEGSMNRLKYAQGFVLGDETQYDPIINLNDDILKLSFKSVRPYFSENDMLMLKQILGSPEIAYKSLMTKLMLKKI